MSSCYPARQRYEALIQKLVDSGRFTCGAEVVDAARQLLDDHEKLREIRLAELNAMIDEGLASAERGDLYDADEVFDGMIGEAEARATG